MKNFNNKGFAPIVIILIIAGVLVVAGGVYYYKQTLNSKPPITISVLSPNGGEKWEIGSIQKISWQVYNKPKNAWVALFLERENNSLLNIGEGYKDNSITWQVPKAMTVGDIAGGYSLSTGVSYRIEARLYQGKSLCWGLDPYCQEPTLLARDDSDMPFSVIPSKCVEVITPAKNPTTGECKNFLTPCDVPIGWEKIVEKCKFPTSTIIAPSTTSL